jgi:chemotaxis methyl-accepting protein methylase
MRQMTRQPFRESWDADAADRRAADAAARAERDAFARILARITRSSGFRIGDDTMQGLRSVIWERVQARGAASAAGYLLLLDDPAELAALHNAISIRDTRFFRTPSQFWLLRDDVLPLLWLRRGASTQLRLWSAGCATGEEAYSLGIVALDAAIRTNVAASPPALIMATDVNPDAMAAAEAGLYSERALGNVPTDIRARYFDRIGSDFRVSAAVRSLIHVQRSSLLDPVWPVADGSIDVLICQNVLRFLPRDEVRGTVERLCASLASGGYLFLGHGETLPRADVDLEYIQLPSASFYQKPERRT